MVFVLAFGMNTAKSKEKIAECPCDCLNLLSEAVEAVVSSTSCDLYGFWEAPEDLMKQLENIQLLCTEKNKPSGSKTNGNFDEVLETIREIIKGKSNTMDDGTVVVLEPAPDCAMEALLNLQTLLLYGCPVQVIENL